ncbi:MAG TPA: hypothetical protein VFV00_00575 [Acidimicrobiales bacterium]|nr:hypothetical protein [Acidimicrobiales bacterium]
MKVRCTECGAKNTDPLADRCRLCRGLLPGFRERRAAQLDAKTEGRAFTEMVESEVHVWQDLERRTDEGPRSRRPTENEPNGDGERRWSWRRAKSG